MLEVRNITKSYQQNKEELLILGNITTNIKEGEFVVIVGANGVGKSTFLKILAGVDLPDSGTISGYKKCKPQLSTGFVFQNYNDSLLPWKTVLKNVALPLRAQGISTPKAKEMSRSLLKEVGLEKHMGKYPYQLSGGMKQLTAIARAYIGKPDIFLLDEPTSALDYSTTKFLQKMILDLWRKQKITTVCVSHDPDEALFLADRILVFSDKPAVIKEEILVDLPRPRNHDVLTSKKFFAYRKRLLNSLQYEK